MSNGEREPQPIGMREIAELIGVTLSTVRKHRQRRTLPAPRGEISGAPFWWDTDIMEWDARRRTVGRPRDRTEEPQ